MTSGEFVCIVLERDYVLHGGFASSRNFLNSHHGQTVCTFLLFESRRTLLLIDGWMPLDKAARVVAPSSHIVQNWSFEKAARNSKQELTARSTLFESFKNQSDLTPSTVLLVLLLIS